MPKVAALALLGLLAPFQLTDGAMVPRQTTDFGVCTNPTITYVQDQDGMLGYGYKPSNTNDFPHGATADIATIIDFIRSTLQNACRAPTATWFLCTTAAAAANGKEGQDAADAFNNVMNQSSPLSEASQAPAPAVSAAAVQPSLNMKFSKETVVFGDHIDPIWWFNEYLKADGQPAICDETPHRMPNNHYITFTCEGADPKIVPMMKEALIAVVKDTIDNTALPDDQRMFMHREGLAGMDTITNATSQKGILAPFSRSLHMLLLLLKYLALGVLVHCLETYAITSLTLRRTTAACAHIYLPVEELFLL